MPTAASPGRSSCRPPAAGDRGRVHGEGAHVGRHDRIVVDDRVPAPPELAAEMLTNRLVRNRRHLGRWARREGVTCWRLYDRDIPDVAVTIDDYEGALVIAD